MAACVWTLTKTKTRGKHVEKPRRELERRKINLWWRLRGAVEESCTLPPSSVGMFPLEHVQTLLTHLSVAFKGSVPIRQERIRKVELAVDF